jgi:hypothetical protein
MFWSHIGHAGGGLCIGYDVTDTDTRAVAITRLIEEQPGYYRIRPTSSFRRRHHRRSIASVRAPAGRQRRISANRRAEERLDSPIVRQAGNYGEVFERNIRTATGPGIPRGLGHLRRRYLLRPTHPLKGG